ncbi:MAG: hypothetical protein LUF04_02610 [Bacteroides sp.]|nr:hypothetical protein [Bacteroides sp.]
MQSPDHTHPSTLRKVGSLWYILFSGFFLPLYPFGILYIALRAKNRKWMKVFLATFAVYLPSVLLAGLFGNSFAGFGALIFFIGWGFCVAYLFATAKEFLRYLYEPGYEPPVEASRRSSGKNISDEVTARGSGLIRSLNKWKKRN